MNSDDRGDLPDGVNRRGSVPWAWRTDEPINQPCDRLYRFRTVGPSMVSRKLSCCRFRLLIRRGKCTAATVDENSKTRPSTVRPAARLEDLQDRLGAGRNRGLH